MEVNSLELLGYADVSNLPFVVLYIYLISSLL
jgi:hypothetical protein